MPERLIVMVTHYLQNSQSAFSTIFGLTFDLLTSKSDRFMFVSNCTEVIN